MDAIDIISIILSLVALAVTIIGFFASLKFYRDGVEMQAQATRALAKIEERAAAIQAQVGGIFDKTLDAALGRNPREVQQEQSALQEAAAPNPTPAFPVGASARAVAPNQLPADAASAAELMEACFRYFMFRQLRLTDVSGEPARSIFLLGGGGGFNLFDGTPGIVFFGYFHQLAPEEIVARVRGLFGNLELAYARLREVANPQVAEVRRLLDRISVELLVPEEVDTRRLAAKLDEFQPTSRKVDVATLKPSDVARAVEAEFERMRI